RHEAGWEAAVQRNRVTVALVQVVAGTDRGVARTQVDRDLRLALDAEFQRRAVKSAKGEHLPGHLEHRVLRAEREVLERPNLRETASPQLRRVHASNRRTSGQGGPTRVRPDVVCVLREEQSTDYTTARRSARISIGVPAGACNFKKRQPAAPSSPTGARARRAAGDALAIGDEAVPSGVPPGAPAARPLHKCGVDCV